MLIHDTPLILVICSFTLNIMIHCELNSRTRIFPIIYISQCTPSFTPSSCSCFTFKVTTEEFYHFFALKNCLSCIRFMVLLDFQFSKRYHTGCSLRHVLAFFTHYVTNPGCHMELYFIHFHYYTTGHCVYILQFIYWFF